MKNASYVKWHKRRRIPERIRFAVDAWNNAFPTELTNVNNEINLAVEARLRHIERAMKIKIKYLDR